MRKPGTLSLWVTPMDQVPHNVIEIFSLNNARHRCLLVCVWGTQSCRNCLLGGPLIHCHRGKVKNWLFFHVNAAGLGAP
jgi:hypothetical protein